MAPGVIDGLVDGSNGKVEVLGNFFRGARLRTNRETIEDLSPDVPPLDPQLTIM
jgi:hypothetical protein